MTRQEAEKFARGCLYRYRENLARLEQKRMILDSLSSYKGVTYNDHDTGKSSAWYVEPYPLWLEQKEFVEEEIRGLELIVLPITRLIADLERADVLDVWRLKFDRGLSWKAAQAEALKMGITERVFLYRYNKIIDMAVAYLGLSVKL